MKLVHLVGFIIKKTVAMRGHMNVKFDLLMSADAGPSGRAV